MARSRLTVRVLAAVALGSLALAGCGGGGSGGSSLPASGLSAPQRVEDNAPATALYLSDSTGKSVFRFARNSNGTLVAPPGSSLVLPYNPGPIAIGRNGYLFVTDQGNESIEVYAKGASGYQQPRRTLLLPFAPSSIAVDRNGYEYVGGYTNGFVAVYAPGAHGMAGTVQRIALPDGHPTINGVAVDSAGNLYVSDSNEVSEFGTPAANPTLLRAIVGSGELNAPAGMAVDARTGELYVANAGDANILAYSPSANGQSRPDRTIASKSPSLVLPVAVALKGNALYSTSGSKLYGTPSLFLLDAARGRQLPKQVVTGNYLAAPVGVALGP